MPAECGLVARHAMPSKDAGPTASASNAAPSRRRIPFPRSGLHSPLSPEALETHRAAITGHCYRMLGSSFDAEDAAQETMVRAWRSRSGFDARSSVRTWLYRIATNVCLDELKDRRRRARPMEEGAPGPPDIQEEHLGQEPATHWLEPIADARALPPGEGPSGDESPAERAMLKQSLRLAFAAALQRLAPRQRASLLLTEVLGFSAAETAHTLGTSVASVNSALQRARATLPAPAPNDSPELSEQQEALLDRYVEAFARYDVSSLTRLMRQDVSFCMPPFRLWLQGPEAVERWMRGLGAGCEGSRFYRTEANGLPAFAQWRVDPAGGHRAWALIVLELAGDRIAGVNNFLDVDRLFPGFGLPLTLPPGAAIEPVAPPAPRGSALGPP